MSTASLIALTVAIIAVYFFLCNRLALAVQPLRLAVASLGEELLAAGKLPPKIARRLEIEMSSVYASRVMWLFIVMIPVAAGLVLLDTILRREDKPPPIPHDLREKYARVQRYIWASRFAASPLATIIFIPEVMLIYFVMVIFLPKRAVKEAIETSQKTEDMVGNFGGQLARAT
jgi:hypothetical protein